MAGVLRRLQGVPYWVIDDPGLIHEFINTNVRLEWETDVIDAGGIIENDPWLHSLSQKRWTLEVLRLREVCLNPVVMNYKDEAKGYDFQASLAKRGAILENGLKSGAVIWPLVVDETLMLRDGYCRYSTLGSLGGLGGLLLPRRCVNPSESHRLLGGLQGKCGIRSVCFRMRLLPGSLPGF